MIRPIVCIAGILAMLMVTVGCSTLPITLGVTTVGDAFGSLTRSHADDTFLIEKAVVFEGILYALDVMALQVEETIEKDDTTIITGASRSSKAPVKFSANIREISSTVTNVSIRAGRSILKPDHSTAEEIMNQLFLRLEKSVSSERSPERVISVATSEPVMLPVSKILKSEHAKVAYQAARPSPYVVQVGAYRTKANADWHMEELRDNKRQAYVVPFNLPGRGRWYRVLIQRFATTDEARRFAEKIMADGLVDLAFPILLPFAVEVGTKKHMHDASPVEVRLRSEGFSPYVLKIPNAGLDDQEYLILVGAYKTSNAAAMLSETLLSARIPNQIVVP
ncbi:MAG: hypothetical protein CMH81_07920 [Nitrospiraceae bacterium]|jgi:cell division septation protein DedD|nr:hypothetical protein [Nitrospiraceae bacterium]